MRARETIEIPRAWLAVLAGSLLVTLLLVAYLVGRESGRRATEAPATRSSRAVSTSPETPASTVGAEAPPAPRPPLEAAPEAGHELTTWGPAEVSPDAEQSVAWPDAAGAPGAADPQGTAVAAYFSEIEALEQQAKYWSNPQELAMSLVSQGAQGDTSGMQQLLETQRAAQRQIEAMTVPLPCQEHHRRTVEVLGRALKLLETLEGGLASGDIDGLLAVSGEARQLEADTREVDAIATQVKRRFGLAGP